MIRTVLIWLLFAGSAWAQGQSRDLRGIWQATGTAYQNLEGTPAQRGQPAAKSIVVDPSNGRIPTAPMPANRRIATPKNAKTPILCSPVSSPAFHARRCCPNPSRSSRIRTVS